MYGSSYVFQHYIAIFRERSYCLLRDAQLMSNVVRGELRSLSTTLLDTTRPSTIFYQLLSQKALGTLPEDGNIMPKHVEV
jgi:hypothetical protein